MCHVLCVMSCGVVTQELIELIKITETEISGCLDESRDLLDDASHYLDDAGAAYSDVSRELSRVDTAHDRLTLFVDDLSQLNIDLRPLVDQATEHAIQLQLQADELDRFTCRL